MKYFTKTAISPKALGNALKARTRYMEEALKVIPRELKLGKELLLKNRKQIDRLGNIVYNKGWGDAMLIRHSRNPREVISRTRKAMVPSEQFREVGKTQKYLVSKGL